MRFASLCAGGIRASLGRGRSGLRGLIMLVVLMPVFAALQLFHWLCLALDEVLFPAYRRVRVVDPVFVVGVPRSGTTLLHRVLAEDTASTTFSAWECLFAPSLLQRHVLRGIARLDKLLGRPVGRLLGWLERRITGPMQSVHPTALAAPEEDFLALLPAMACFLLVVPFPQSDWVWRLGRFDEAMDERSRAQLLEFYRRLVMRHVYFHGAHKRFLSKNPSFSPMVTGLRETFPSARLIACLRDPLEAVPSQLSSLREGMALFGHEPGSEPFRSRMIDQMAWYYEHLLEELPGTPENRQALVWMPDLQRGISASVQGLYRRLDLPLRAAYTERLAALDAEMATYRSSHSYSPDGFGLTEAEIRQRFDSAYRHMNKAAA